MNTENACNPGKSKDDQSPKPTGELALRLIPTAGETNIHGDISGGWVVSHMDHAAETMASRLAHGRIANVAMEQMVFMSPIRVGAAVCFFTNLQDIGSSSIRVGIEVWTQNPDEDQRRKVADAVFVYVAIDETGRIRRVPR